MAILSNINDKFAVDSTGAIKFNGQAGTSGYILKSNGNAAPTWVDPDTVIGGPYLPLTGGTLTGNLAINGSNSLTVGGVISAGGDITTSGKVNAGDRIKTEATTSNALLQVKYNSSNYLEGYYDKLNVVGGDFLLQRGGDTKIKLTAVGTTFTNLSNTSAASSSVDEIKIGTFGAGRPAIYFGSSNTTYTNSTWFIENIGAAGKLRIGRNGLDIVEIFNNGSTTFAGTVQTTQITATNGLNYLKRNTDASLQLRSENTRSGLFITKPATDTVMGSALVLADESYRLGTASYYHMIMLQNGNTYFNQSVGIGTASPNGKLNISNGGANGLEIDPTQSSGAVTLLQSYNRSGSAYTLMKMNAGSYEFQIADSTKMRIDANGNVAIQPGGATLTNTRLNVVALDNYDPSLYDGMGGIRIGTAASGVDGSYTGGIGFAIASGTSGIAGVQKGADSDKQGLAFFTHPSTTGGDAAEEKMRLDADGNVGIGTISPDAKLEVASGQAKTVTSGVEFARFGTSNEATGFATLTCEVKGAAAAANRKWIFQTIESGVANAGNIVFQPSGGNIGIGTETPGAQLHNYSTATQNVWLSGYGTLAQNNWGAGHGIFAAQDNGLLISKANAANNTNRLFVFYHDSGGNGEQYIYDTNSTAKVKLDSAGDSYFNGGDVGIGTTSPGGNLEIKTLSGGSGVNTLRLNTNFANGNTVDINPFITGLNNGGMEIKLAGSQKLVMLPSGNVGIGNTAPQTTLHTGPTTTITNAFTARFAASNFFANGGNSMFYVPDTAANIMMFGSNQLGTNQIEFYHKNPGTSQSYVGRISTSGSATSYVTSSDYRLKENVIPMSDSISRINQLKPSRFNFIIDPETTVDGFLAHEVQNIVPEAIVGKKDAVNEDGSIIPQGIDQAKLVPLLVAAIQELEARVKELENK